ncbi:MAG: ECF transporter S component [Clostridia bacterium]|nr:ECF transporter S component [Clostridia bacterium]
MKANKRVNTRFLVVSAMLGAVAFALMFIDFSVPFMPAFIKMDISDLPALIGAYAMGPVSGCVIELIKIVLHLVIRGTTTGYVGELSNFILGCFFVIPAGLIYKLNKTKKAAVISAIVGALAMGLMSFITNLWLVYPIYYNFMPKDAIIQAYQAILPKVKSIEECLIIFNVPFTTIKGLLSAAITVVIYKPLSPIIKGKY